MNRYILLLITFAASKASPQIVADLRSAVNAMVDRSSKTNNPFDEMLCGMLQHLIGKPGDVTEDPLVD